MILPICPQIRTPIVNDPTFWERLGLDAFGIDTLLFIFYYLQNTMGNIFASKELK